MIGLIVNPIAGMGGSVGLKGTDGPETLSRARALGATPHAAERARRTLAILAQGLPGTTVLAPAGEMGADTLEGLDLGHPVQARPGVQPPPCRIAAWI